MVWSVKQKFDLVKLQRILTKHFFKLIVKHVWDKNKPAENLQKIYNLFTEL